MAHAHAAAAKADKDALYAIDATRLTATVWKAAYVRIRNLHAWPLASAPPAPQVLIIENGGEW